MTRINGVWELLSKSVFRLAVFTVLITSCNVVQPSGQAVSPVDTFIPPDNIPATTLSSPAAEMGEQEQYTVADPYAGTYRYRITYSTGEWRVDTTETRDGPEYPELEHLSIEGCRLYLREGPRGLPLIGKRTLAEYTWQMYEVGEKYPNHVVYSLDQPDKGIAFIIGLDWPRQASSDTQDTCRLAAEAVLDSVVVLD